MGTFHIAPSVQLEQPLGEVWDFLMSNDHWRRPFVRSVLSLTTGEIGVGSRYENVIAFGPISFVVVNEITRFDPPQRLTWRQVNTTPITTVEGNYILEPSHGGTRFSLESTAETHGWTAPPAFVAKWSTEKLIARRLFTQLRDGLSAAAAS